MDTRKRIWSAGMCEFCESTGVCVDDSFAKQVGNRAKKWTKICNIVVVIALLAHARVGLLGVDICQVALYAICIRRAEIL